MDIDRIARKLGAERIGTVKAGGGYFGALQLSADVATRFRAPDVAASASPKPEERLVRMSPATLDALERLAAREQATPMHVASVLLEKAVHAMLGCDSPQNEQP